MGTMNKLRCVLAIGCVASLTTAALSEVAQTNAPLRLTVDLVDGSRVVGTPAIAAVPVETSYAKMNVPLKQIQTLKIGEDHETVTLDLKNGDTLKGVINLAPLKLTTAFGEIAISIAHIRQFDVARTGGSLPEALCKGLVLYYSFDRDEKEKVSDNSDQHNDGITHGATWTPQGKNGGAYKFNGTSDFITMKPSARMDDVGDFTVALWTFAQPRKLQVNGSGAWIDRQYILDAHSDAESGQYQTGFFLIYDFSNSGSCQIHNGIHIDNSARGTTEQNTQVDIAQKWHQLVFARRGTDDFTYLDGKLLESTYSREIHRNDSLDLNHTWSIGTFAGNNQTGGGPKVNYSFQGVLDEVMVFNRALAEDEVKQLFELQK